MQMVDSNCFNMALDIKHNKNGRNTVTLECHLFVIYEAKNYNTLQLPGNIDECVLGLLLTGKHMDSMGIHY